MTKKYRVIGYPIGHTMSPFIQKELFKLTSFEGDYEKLEFSVGYKSFYSEGH